MLDSKTVLTFVIVSFCLAGVLILKRDSIPDRIRKFLALTTLVLICFSFFLIVYMFFTAGSQ
ncbi:hypothetical protein J2TS4_30550 [Paenibacillus sp. J2TS4]|nr:hypothetical protein J2TS4_30550 [Paenibacillus sp. J2TS4]